MRRKSIQTAAAFRLAIRSAPPAHQYKLKRTGRYTLVTMRIGGGQGIAVIFERA
jgi:acetyl-CoA acetyltransferase